MSSLNSNSTFSIFKVNLHEALEIYQREHLAVIPLAPKDKHPFAKLLADRGYVNERGQGTQKPIYDGAHPTPEDIQYWFSHEPTPNVGVVCGRVSDNLIVIDIDSTEALLKFNSEVLPALSESLRDKINRTWWVKTGKGVHIYLKAPKNVKIKTRRKEGMIEIRGERAYVAAPPSIHPSGHVYTFIKNDPRVEPIQKLTLNEYKELINTLSSAFFEKRQEREEATESEPTKTRKLTDEQILTIVSLLKPAYRPGFRDLIIFYLTGWLRKCGVDYDSARRIVELLAQDDEEFAQRIYVLDRTYGLRGSPPEPTQMSGKSGLFEVLCDSLENEERATTIVRMLEELLQTPYIYRDIIMTVVDYTKQIYFVANMRRKIIVRAYRDEEEGLVYRERVVLGVPEKVELIINPFTKMREFRVKWVTNHNAPPIEIDRAGVDDIIDILRNNGLIVSNRLARDAIPAILYAIIEKGLGEVKEEYDRDGFYINERGEPVVVGYSVEDVREDELREALLFLNELATVWYSHIRPKFVTVLKWFLIAPFIFVVKLQKRWVPWLYLYGVSKGGKSTLGEIGLSIWALGLKTGHIKTGSTIDTPARIGEVLSSSTFPILINEPAGALSKDDVVEIIKASVESTVCRGKFKRGVYRIIPALAPLCFTSNKFLPRDDALLRRMVVITFSYAERISEEKAVEFEKKVKPQFSKLRAIGKFVAKFFLSKPEYFVKRLTENWSEFAEELLRMMYLHCGLPVPDWVSELHREEEEPYEDYKEIVRSVFVDVINKAFYRATGRTDASLRERVEYVLCNHLIPWLILKNGNVVITPAIRREHRDLIEPLGGLKGLAELLGWNYGVVKLKGKSCRAVMVQLEEFIDFLTPEGEEGAEPIEEQPVAKPGEAETPEEDIDIKIPEGGSKYYVAWEAIKRYIQKYGYIDGSGLVRLSQKLNLALGYVVKVLNDAIKNGEIVEFEYGKYKLVKR